MWGMMRPMRWLLLPLLLLACDVVPPQHVTGDAGTLCASSGAAWPEADALFQHDPSWLGADAAYSVDLGNERVLWLFGDTFIARGAARQRTDAYFIRNSVAIQSGSYDPSAASAKFAWKTKGTAPSSYFPEDAASWHWPAGGVRLASRLLLFWTVVHPANNAFGFEVTGPRVVSVATPDSAPSAWAFTDVAFPTPAFSVMLLAPLVSGSFVYVYAVREPGDHRVYVARVPLKDAELGVFSKTTWFTADRGWQDVTGLSGEPTVVFPGSGTDNPTEFSVQEQENGTFLAVQSVGFGATRLALRTAPAPEGPWTAPCAVFQPVESSAKGAFVYAGKGHPELTGADVVATYAANSLDGNKVLTDMSLYFPRFVKVNAP